MPNFTFAILASLSIALISGIGGSTHHLIIAGAPTLAGGGPMPALDCLLLPIAGDFVPHVASYIFLIAISASSAAGLRTLMRQRRQTNRLLRGCLATGSPDRSAIQVTARDLDLAGRLDIADLPAPIAFCYGFLRPRIIVSTGLLRILSEREMEALLLHEREHLRQRDPLKVSLGKLLCSALFFVPAVGAFYGRYLVEKELAADRAAITAQGSPDYLASAMAGLIEHGTAMAPLPGPAASDALETRVSVLLGEPVRVGLNIDGLRWAGSFVVILLCLAPLLGVALPSGNGILSSHNLAGCHVPG